MLSTDSQQKYATKFPLWLVIGAPRASSTFRVMVYDKVCNHCVCVKCSKIEFKDEILDFVCKKAKFKHIIKVAISHLEKLRMCT